MPGQNGEIQSWDNSRRFIQSGEIFGLECLKRLGTRLEESNAYLAPFEDPLQVDFGVHRWLRREREEAYSDWLAWIVEQIAESKYILPMFEIDDSALVARCHSKPIVEREFRIFNGKRRLDLVIEYGSEVLVVVEIKVTSAEEAETQKQEDYCAWIVLEAAERKFRVLLVTDAAELEYRGFRTLLWEDVCIYLRKLMPAVYQQRGTSIAAMILAFVGAVETNLLGLCLGYDGRIFPSRVPRILFYLDRALSPEEHS